MRILAVDLGASLRGGQRQTLLVSSALAGGGEDVALVAREGSPLARDAAAAGLALHPVRGSGEASPGFVLGLRRAFRSFRPDVVWAGDAWAHGAAVWALLQLRAPLAVHRRVAFAPRLHPLSRLKYAAADLYLAVSSAVAESLERAGVPGRKIRIVRDGLSPEAFRDDPPPPSPPFRLVHAGAFDGRKGQELVVDLLARLVSRGTDATALFLGDGPQRPAVEERAAAAGLRERCEFRGEVAGPTAVSSGLAASHILLLPSESEGAALVLAEAMAAGCVPVAHDVGGCAEVLDGGAGGRLVPSLDLAAWDGAVSSLLLDPAERTRLAERGRRLAAERTIANAAARIREELAALVGGAGGAAR